MFAACPASVDVEVIYQNERVGFMLEQLIGPSQDGVVYLRGVSGSKNCRKQDTNSTNKEIMAC